MNPSRIRVKMCGMTRREDIAQAVKLGVDAVGLIFYPGSSRAINMDRAQELLNDLPPFIEAVAVLVNPEPVFVQQIINHLPIHLLQFHGDESLEFCQQFNKPFIKAIRPESEANILSYAREFLSARALLLDTPSDQFKGGTGQVFDWQIIPPKIGKPYILAGGLDEFNILEALKTCRPFAVDLCSGIEKAPGIKDHDKMVRFMNKISEYRLID